MEPVNSANDDLLSRPRQRPGAAGDDAAVGEGLGDVDAAHAVGRLVRG